MMDRKRKSISPPTLIGLVVVGLCASMGYSIAAAQTPAIADMPGIPALPDMPPTPGIDSALIADPCPDGALKGPTARAWDWPNLCKYQSANAALTEPVRVVFIGDSITEAWASADPVLFAHGIVGRGISGQTTPQMLIRFYSDVISLHPKIVHILAGTNDVAGNTGLMTVQDYQHNIEAMVDMAQAHHIRVVIGSIPPASVFPWRMNFRPAATIKILNAWLQQFCHEHRLSYVDYYAVLADSEGGLRKEFGADAVHPNQAGYAAMHALALRAIQ